MGVVNKRVEREPQVLALDDLSKPAAAGIELGAMLLEALVIDGIRERYVLPSGVTREQHTRFFEQLAGGSHLEGQRVIRRDTGQFSTRARHSVAPAVIRRPIVIVHTAARKYMCARHERDRVMPPDQEYFRARRTVAEDDHRRGRMNLGARAHMETIAGIETTKSTAELAETAKPKWFFCELCVLCGKCFGVRSLTSIAIARSALDD